MPRWLLSAAVLALLAGFSGGSARAGLFSHGHDDDCVPSCAAPIENCAPIPSCSVPLSPTCCAPTACAPVVGPSCAIPVTCGDRYNYVETGCCETESCERECVLKRCFRKMMDLERRKNQCLKDTFLGWRDNDDCHSGECAPVYYYEPGCAVPGCAVPY